MLKEANQFFENRHYSEAENLYIKFISNFPELSESIALNLILTQRKLGKNLSKFSFILPTYNRKDTIIDSVKSVLNQNYPNNCYEIIIVDDGSTDNTENLIKNTFFKELNNNIIKYYKNSKNQGVCATRNIGLSKANNEWIAYIDSDNSIYKNFLQSYHLAIMLNRNTKVFYAKFKRRYSKKIIGEKNFSHSKLLKGNFIDLGVFVHHKTITDEIGLFDSNLKRLVDYDFIIRATNKFLPVFIDKILLDYNDDNNIKNRITIKESYDDAIEIIRKKYNL